jgi:hypothetical protein
MRTKINEEEYLAIAEFDNLIKKECKKLFFDKKIPAFLIVGVLEKAKYGMSRTAEDFQKDKK